LRVSLVFVDDAVKGPAGQLADGGDNASGAVLAVIAVNQEGIISAIQDNVEDGGHCACRNGLLFCSLHVEDNLLDAIGADEGLELVVDFISLNQCAIALVSY
jgi:hypothetical protein